MYHQPTNAFSKPRFEDLLQLLRLAFRHRCVRDILHHVDRPTAVARRRHFRRLFAKFGCDDGNDQVRQTCLIGLADSIHYICTYIYIYVHCFLCVDQNPSINLPIQGLLGYFSEDRLDE